MKEYEETHSYRNKSSQEEHKKVQKQKRELAREISDLEEKVSAMTPKGIEDSQIATSDAERSSYASYKRTQEELNEKELIMDKLEKELDRWKNRDTWINNVEEDHKKAQEEVQKAKSQVELFKAEYNKCEQELQNAEKVLDDHEKKLQAEEEYRRAEEIAKRQGEIEKKLKQTEAQNQKDIDEIEDKIEILKRNIKLAEDELKLQHIEIASKRKQKDALETLIPQIEQEVDHKIKKEKEYRSAIEAEILAEEQQQH